MTTPTFDYLKPKPSPPTSFDSSGGAKEDTTGLEPAQGPTFDYLKAPEPNFADKIVGSDNAFIQNVLGAGKKVEDVVRGLYEFASASNEELNAKSGKSSGVTALKNFGTDVVEEAKTLFAPPMAFGGGEYAMKRQKQVDELLHGTKEGAKELASHPISSVASIPFTLVGAVTGMGGDAFSALTGLNADKDLAPLTQNQRDNVVKTTVANVTLLGASKLYEGFVAPNDALLTRMRKAATIGGVEGMVYGQIDKANTPEAMQASLANAVIFGSLGGVFTMLGGKGNAARNLMYGDKKSMKEILAINEALGSTASVEEAASRVASITETPTIIAGSDNIGGIVKGAEGKVVVSPETGNVLVNPGKLPIDITKPPVEIEEWMASPATLWHTAEDFFRKTGYLPNQKISYRGAEYTLRNVGDNIATISDGEKWYEVNKNELRQPEKLEIDTPSKMASLGEGKAGIGIDPRVLKTLGQNLYSGSIEKTIIKEGIQNAVDAVRSMGSKGRVDVRIDKPNNTITIYDNGTGMTKETATEEFLNLGGSKKEEGSSGGFGLAKVALLAESKHFELHTTVREPGLNGELVTTSIVGSGEDWANGNLRVENKLARPGAETGTTLSVQLPEDKARSWTGATNYAATFKSRSKLGETVNITSIDQFGKPEDIAGSYTRVLGEEPAKYPEKPTATISAPGAKLDIYPATELKTTVYWGENIYAGKGDAIVHVANNGMYQFSFTTKLTGVKEAYPAEWVINTKSTVPPTDAKYPFTASREAYKTDVQRAVDQYFKTLGNEANKNEVKVLVESITQAPDLGGMGHKLVDDSGGLISRELQENIAKKPYMTRLNAVVHEAFNVILDELKGGRKYRYSPVDIPDVEYLGLGFNDKALGTNISLKTLHRVADEGGVPFKAPKAISKGTANAVLISPYSILKEVSDEHGAIVNGNNPPEDILAGDLAATYLDTIVHEIAHQFERGHEERFAGALTRLITDAAGAIDKLMPKLTATMRDLLDNSDYFSDFEEVDREWEQNADKRSQSFRKLSGHYTEALQRDTPGGNETGGKDKLAEEIDTIRKGNESSGGTDIQGEPSKGASYGSEHTGLQPSGEGALFKLGDTPLVGEKSLTGEEALKASGGVTDRIVTPGEAMMNERRRIPLSMSGQEVYKGVDRRSAVQEAAGTNNMMVDMDNTVRDKESGKVIGNAASSTDAEKIINEAGQAGGNDLTPPDAPPPPNSGDMVPPSPTPKPYLNPAVIKDIGSIEKLKDILELSLPWMTKKSAVFRAIDSMHGTKLFAGVSDKLYKAQLDLANAVHPWIENLRNLMQHAEGMSPKMLSDIFYHVQARSADELIMNGVSARGPYKQGELELAAKWSDKMDGQMVDIDKIYLFNREMKEVNASYQQALANMNNNANANPGIKAIMQQAVKELEQKQAGIIDKHLMTDKELTVAKGFEEVLKKGDIDNLSLYYITELMRKWQNPELNLTQAQYAAKNDMSATQLALSSAFEQMNQSIAKARGLENVRHINGYMYHFRRTGDIPDVIKSIQGAPTLRGNYDKAFAGDLIRSGEVSDYVDNPFVATATYVLQAFRHDIIHPALKDAQATAVAELNKLPDDITGKQARFIGRINVEQLIDGVRGKPPIIDAAIEGALHNSFATLGMKLPKNAARDLANTFLSWTSASMLAGKPELGLRDMSTFLTLYYSRFGAKRTASAIKAIIDGSATKVISEGHAPGLTSNDNKAMQDIWAANDQLETGKIKTAKDFAQFVGDKAMFFNGQKSAFQLVHAAGYAEAFTHVTEQLKDFYAGKIDSQKFADNIHLNTYDKPIANQFIELVNKGEELKAVEFMARQTGLEAGFLHGLNDHPYLWNSIPGRLFGQFGIYPVSAINYVGRMATRGSVTQRTAAMGRFVAVTGAIKGLGYAAGFNLANWSALHGLGKYGIFTGGPLAQNATDAIDGVTALAGQAMGSENLRDQDETLRNFETTYGLKYEDDGTLTWDANRFAHGFRSMWVPGSYAFHNYVDAFDMAAGGYGIAPVIGRGLGFNLGSETNDFLTAYRGGNPPDRDYDKVPLLDIINPIAKRVEQPKLR